MLKILPEIKNLIPQLSDEEFTQLETNIKRDGCLDPIVTTTVNNNEVIIDGHNRFAICTKHNIPFKSKKISIKNMSDIKIWVINHQFGRRNLSDFSRAELALKMKELVAAKAKEKMLSGKADPVQNYAQGRKTRDIIGKAAGVSHFTIDRVEKIKKEVKDKKVLSELRTGKKTINKVFSEIKIKERREEIEKTQKDIDSGKHSLPEGTYEIIVIDPPWQYDDDGSYNPETRRGTAPYPTMTIDKIKKLTIPSSKDCVLWLWTTHKHMRYAFELLDEWGFTEKSILTWCKQKMGIGKWLRSKSEFCIMAVKGKPKVNLTNQTTVLDAPSRQHSRKPDEFYAMVTKLCVGRKLDYFSREQRKGWDTYGSGNKF